MGRKKLKAKEQVNGALTGKSIYELMGKKIFPYDEHNLEDYRKKLDAMDFADLQRHAVQVANILPNVDKRDRLIDKLEREFLRKLYQFAGSPPPQGISTEKASPEIMKILARGR